MNIRSGGAAAARVVAEAGAIIEDDVRDHLLAELEAARIQARAAVARILLLGTSSPLPMDEYADASEAVALAHSRLAGFARLLSR